MALFCWNQQLLPTCINCYSICTDVCRARWLNSLLAVPPVGGTMLELCSALKLWWFLTVGMNGSTSIHFLLASEHETHTHRLHFKKHLFRSLCIYILHVTRYSKNGNYFFGDDKENIKRERKHLEEEKRKIIMYCNYIIYGKCNELFSPNPYR